jgi:hypothetical protein
MSVTYGEYISDWHCIGDIIRKIILSSLRAQILYVEFVSRMDPIVAGIQQQTTV